MNQGVPKALPLLMHVQFRCPNSHPDPTGHKRPCGRQLRAPRDKSGHLAKCPQCGGKVKIPSRSAPEFATPSPVPMSNGSSPSVSEDDELYLRVAQDDYDDPVLDGATRTGAIETSRSRKNHSPKANRRTANFLPVDSVSRCRKCGKKTDQRGYCGSCNYSSASRDKTSTTPIDDIKITATGMQLWVSNVVAEGVPPGSLALGVHFLFTGFLVATLFALFTATSGLMFVAASGFVLATAFFYLANVWKMWQFRHDPYTQLAWFQRPFWDGVLWYCRKQNWADAKNPKRVVIDARHSPMTNRELDKVKDLKNASVLDLEGTMINDDAFRFFYRIDDLQCLVLKDTAVSHEAVFRLQQARPKLWIWY